MDLKNIYSFGTYSSLGELVSSLLPVVLNLAAVAVVFLFILGVVRLIISGGDKNAIAAARSTIVHAVIGLIILIIMFVFARYIVDAIGLINYNVIP